MNVLVLEPYYGGSHQAFLDGVEEHLDWHIQKLTLPPRAWKWRMRFAAPAFAESLANSQEPIPDLILASTFLSVADFRALAPAAYRDLPVVTYWHENQWAYPVQKNDERDRHFVITNYTTALSSDYNLFNSEWNRSSFLAGIETILKAAPDADLSDTRSHISQNSAVLPVPLDIEPIEKITREPGPPRILWNHRWEHDKNPTEFFEALFALEEEDASFELIVAGQSFRESPEIFAQAEERLRPRLRHWGFVESRDDYLRLLDTADIVVSTAIHEFFGLSVLEAVLRGARPVVPRRLSYPELYRPACLYDEGQLLLALRAALGAVPQTNDFTVASPNAYTWNTQKSIWQKTFQEIVAGERGGRF